VFTVRAGSAKMLKQAAGSFLVFLSSKESSNSPTQKRRNL
jgi:hypothetical protein